MTCYKPPNPGSQRKGRPDHAKDPLLPILSRFHSLDWGNVRISFPIKVIRTEDGEIYACAERGIKNPPVVRTRLFGPLDPEGDPNMQLEEIMLWMVACDGLQIADEKSKIRAIKKTFQAKVDFETFKTNFKEAVTAMGEGDREAFSKVCPILRPNLYVFSPDGKDTAAQ